MKIFYDKVTVPVSWSFAPDGQHLRSTPVVGYQGEIHKSTLRIYDFNGDVVYLKNCKSRTKGRTIFRSAVSDLLEHK